jgi:hypothetical protein
MSFLPGLSTIVDAAGNFIACTIGQVPPTTNAVGASTTTQAAILQAGLDPNGKVQPINIDASGGLVTRPMNVPTIAYSPASAVSTGASSGKSMMSVYNASTTMYQRILGFEAMCPPQAGVSGGLFSTSSTYTTVAMTACRFTGAHTAGTVITGVVHDSRDASTYDANLTCRVGATIPATQTAPLYTFDAANSATAAYGRREDVFAKVWTIGPGEGLSINCITAVGNSGINFYLRMVLMQNSS